jgi:transcriptional regulator with XRE-family HTH domain
MHHNPKLKIFGEQVRIWRGIRNLSQEELADKCELHRTYIGGIERGERNVALLNILKIAAALEVPPANCLKGSYKWTLLIEIYQSKRGQREPLN